MLLDFEVQRSTRRCAATDRDLQPGETSYSVLEVQGANVVRKDFCSAAWQGPPANSLGWWKSQIPEPSSKKIKLAPNDVLLTLFDELADHAEQQDMRYVLALLLIRRRVFRVDLPSEALTEPATTRSVGGASETMIVYCPKRDATYEIAVQMPDQARIDVIQHQLSELLIAGAN